jgi:hypothetical protein
MAERWELDAYETLVLAGTEVQLWRRLYGPNGPV